VRTRIGLGLSLSVSLVAGSAIAAVPPHRSATELVSSNGRAVVGFDTTQKRVTSFLEHPYRATSTGAQTRDLAYDVYPGIRVGSTGTWLGEVTPSNVAYEPGTGIIHVARSTGGVNVDEYVFAPIGLAEHAFVTLVRMERVSGSGPVDGYMLFNFHLGTGAPDPSANGETISWDSTRNAWMEWGSSGLTLGYGSIGASTHHSASPENPYPALQGGSNLSDNTGTGGTFDDAAAGLQWSLGDLQTGQPKWFGSFVVLDSQSNVAPRIDAVNTWVASRSPDQILSDEKAAWQSWHTTPPTGISSKESDVYQQQMAVLRMGQVSEPGKSDGQLLASLPPGNWNISWVRDMAYASVALSRSGHTAEAKRALEFKLGADSGKYQSEVGYPYQISITRYFGDGVEETDSNQDGPNIEFDGFGLFLWELSEYVAASGDDTSLQAWWPVVSQKVGDVLVKLQESSGLIAPDSSIWEVHWNGQQKHFAYTTITAANGLCLAAKLAEKVGDSARATQYHQAGVKAQNALISELSAPDGTLAQSKEELSSGSGFLDAAAIEAVGFGLVDPKGHAAQATLASMRAKLVPASGRGFMRNDDGGWYDSQEWVFVDLRTSHADRLGGDPEAAALLGWITDQATENFGLISELHDANTADYEGEMPMVGFGAGAYALALMDRASPTTPMPCGSYAPETTNPDGGVGGAAGSSGSAGAAGTAGSAGTGATGGSGGFGGDPSTGGSAGKSGGSNDDGGCGCRTAGHGDDLTALLALGILGLGIARRRRTS
jgi:MYXO-CTERM domain-containing protein